MMADEDAKHEDAKALRCCHDRNADDKRDAGYSKHRAKVLGCPSMGSKDLRSS